MGLERALPAKKQRRPRGSPKLLRMLIVNRENIHYLGRMAAKWENRTPREWSPPRVIEEIEKKRVIYRVIYEMACERDSFTTEDAYNRIMATGEVSKKYDKTLRYSVGNAFQELVKLDCFYVEIVPEGSNEHAANEE